jgi:hypothetical protein
MSPAEMLTRSEKLEDRAKAAFRAAIFFSVFGAICFQWVAPQINPHSTSGLLMMLPILGCACGAAISAIVGLFTALRLAAKHRTICWKGFLAAAISGMFLFLYR